MAECRCSFTIVCLFGFLGGLLNIALQIVAAATKAWVVVKIGATSYAFGLFVSMVKHGITEIKMVKYAPLVVMQAMLVFSIGIGIVGVVTIFLGMAQRELCGRGTVFFITLSQVSFVISAILYLIGLSSFTHAWLQNASKFFESNVPQGAVYSYGYGYSIAWLIFILQLSLALYLIIVINVKIRRQDKKLAGEDGEEKKLIEKSAQPPSEKTVSEVTKPASSTTSSTPTTSHERLEKEALRTS